ncbi:Asp-tRNA(Asn)/Glu-tRNA(Gln) amidotransferase subunit GatA [Marispirochaeta aestuarii]|uniref:Asp-tRNA(Asn)/Glu-tRNA(Gln) amidotransferase subunit GatA n=1 Tax=Marispirochaeta aestuarii TaxID=1963862 RepID=UPI0029C84EDD|nr:Asp-tRNA(Asn)/Glu-tRNA(Gln) amidotransferase subunit GatA [Marispirochaeta aestuarii]
MKNTRTNAIPASWRGMLDDPRRAAAHRSYVDEWEKKINSFVQIDPRPGNGEGALAGVPYGVKDNIAVKGLGLSCGSKILEGFISPYTATAVERLEATGARVYGKCNLDEFGMGSSCENSVHGASSNPWDPARVPGGSSGGSAAAVAAGLVPFALGSDTGGSVRQPASFCGVYGLKPTYGAVSRYGLVAYASSLESIGVLAGDVDTCRQVFDSIKGEDPKDQTSVPWEDRSGESSSRRIAVLEDLSDLSPGVDAVYRKSLEGFRELGWEIVPVRLRTLDYVVPAYYTIATAEASANLARYTGIRYGYRAEGEDHADMVRNTRSEGFGHEVKLRILLGTYVLRSGFQDQYYGRAQRIRTLIGDEFSKVFQGAEMLLMPTFPVAAFPHGESGMDAFQQKLADKFTAAANLAGIPGLSIPAGMDGNVPVGMQLLAPAFCEERLFSAAREFRSVYEPARCPGFKEPS